MDLQFITQSLSLEYDGYLSRVRDYFGTIKDSRAKNIVYSLPDILMSGLAMFILKHPSLYRFEQQTVQEKANLHSLFGIEKLCTDAQMRNILDRVPPDDLRGFFPDYFNQLQERGIIDTYRYFDDCIILAIDGVEHFHSTSIHCENCQCAKLKDGVHYSHCMLAASIVCPDKAEVFPLCLEPIIKQDGIVKNDCERNACERLMKELLTRYARQRFIFTGDALYANAPHIRRIIANSWHFVLNIKPDSHKTLFKAFESRRTHGALDFMEKRENGEIHRFNWANNLPLCESAGDIRVNVLWYEITDKKGKTTRFTWCTDFKIDKRNVTKIMKIGRSRWKIENETFNTLKNQGYHFEHNYGHGYKYLATTLAFLMFMAFAIDQLMQKTSTLFIKVWKAAKTKKRLWEGLRAVFMTQYVKSFKHLYIILAHLFEVQLE